eukprot:TRINITY_DN4089_c0_g1_i5.p1 TRINITY_DN4089_c0_g1~~TRINITY_DN4089_c0_g1_i5.p1  ORF type:complete len:126 (+),score=20.59 TRINITY_DN4089_c0_g1_i5:406-783(+)
MSYTSYKKLLDNSNYEHRICGMHVNVAIGIREAHKHNNDGEFTRIKDNLQALINTNYPGVSFGVAIGGYFTSYFNNSNGKEDIIIHFLSDVTNVDSKMMTFVSKNLLPEVMDGIFRLLYKHDATL